MGERARTRGWREGERDEEKEERGEGWREGGCCIASQHTIQRTGRNQLTPANKSVVLGYSYRVWSVQARSILVR